MNSDRSFGDWLRQHRRALDLTQAELARQVGCSAITLRKLEAEERRPSKQIAERLAEVLNVEPDGRAHFLRFARGDPFAAPGETQAADTSSQPQAPKHNLPLQLTSFIGRGKEIAEVQRLLGQARLVTLTGAGGSGKTRLALEVATVMVDRFPDAVWLVELAPLADAALVPQAVTNALGLKEIPSQSIQDGLLGHLRPKQLLLLLDNCEHLIQACAELAEALLRACPRLTVLATSREALGIAGERVYLVPSLSVPAPGQRHSHQLLEHSEAAGLFVERACAAQPDFTLTNDNAPAVAEICRRLDGIPLAIELAAARVKLLTVEQIVARLDDRFALLTGGSRTALPRHSTLAALIDWSYDLLSVPERVLLLRLAVFAGGWTLDAAEAVCADAGLPAASVLGLLTLLVDKSLVAAVRWPSSETRYHLLETIRQYAGAKLEASGQAQAIRQQQARFFYTLAETWHPLLHTRDLRAGVDRFESNLDNFRAALLWLQAQGDTEIGPWLAVRFYSFLLLRGAWSEAQACLEAALFLTRAPEMARSEVRAAALGNRGILLTYQGDYVAAERDLRESLRLCDEMGYRQRGAMNLFFLGRTQRERGDAAGARRLLLESLARFREVGDQSWSINTLNTLAGVAILQEDVHQATTLIEEALALNQPLGIDEWAAWSLNHWGHIAQLQGDYPRAARRHAACVAHCRELGLQLGLAWGQHGLGESALAQGDTTAALTHLGEGVNLFRDLGDRAGVSWCLAGLAGVAALDEEPERAAQLWGAAEALRQRIGARTAPAARATRERLMAAAREQLGDAAFDAAWAAGQALAPEQAIELALQTSAAG